MLSGKACFAYTVSHMLYAASYTYAYVCTQNYYAGTIVFNLIAAAR